MEMALKEGWKYQLLTYPNPAVGSAGYLRGLFFSAPHRRAGEEHSELNLCWEIFRYFHRKTPNFSTPEEKFHFLIAHHRGFFHNMVMAVTLEPCAHWGKTPPCAHLLAQLKPKKVVIGSRDPVEGHRGGVEILKRAGVEVEIWELSETQILLEPFNRWRTNSFKLFKVGQTLNGTITGGYITSPSSLRWVHQLRAVFDAILIGGETLRTDTPILDARLVGGRPPDVVILTRTPAQIPRNAPLFSVPGRKVWIVSSLEEVEKLGYKTFLVEGGGNFYQIVADWVDWSLFILSPQLRPGGNFQLFRKLQPLWVEQRGEDTLFWSR